ncbi:pyridine nucleotide-disulfide oxidoreductase/dicluster-binding protein [Clostridium sp. JNZ X4-2]
MDLSKLLEMSDRCITEEPPACTAYCPIHVDVMGIMDEIGKENFKKAYKIMAKKMPFARIIGRICDHPCEDVCVRKDLGGSINIGELEKITVEYGFSKNKKGLQIPKNGKNIAVIGGGISGVTVADSLDKKGYGITIYESDNKLGGRFWLYQGKELTGEIIQEELNILADRDIHIKLNRKIHRKELDVIVKEYDAVYLGTGTWKGDLRVDEETFQIEDSPIFIGGRLLNKNESVIYSVSSGKRAAVSIDRYVQKKSMTAVREREGSYVSPVNFNTEDIEIKERVKKTCEKYSAEEASEEAGRCLKCHCTQCVKACSHLKKYNRIPKKYLREIRHNEDIVLGNHYANKVINSCTLCGLCKEVCPSCISMKDAINETRKSMVERNKMPLSAHDFALKDMEFSNGTHFSMAKKQPGYENVKYVFYPGCQLPASQPDYIEKTYEYLMSNITEGVGLVLGCCGAPADWSGRQDLMEKSMEKIKSTWNDMEKPTFILACSTCYSIFEKYMPFIKIISLWEIMEMYGVPLKNKITGEKHILNIHDACTARYNEKVHKSIRNIAGELGYTIEELKFSRKITKCCGYGGLVFFSNREQSNEFIKDRIKEGNQDYLVYCAMCKDLFVSFGKKTYHILDLIYGDDLKNISLKKMPTLSKRHENREKVKVSLLKNIWGEDMENLNGEYGFKLILSENVKEEMEDRFILIEDVKKVIDNAEKNNERFFNPENSHYLARLRIDNVTHWVEYEKTDGGLFVDKVYMHRMQIVEE